MALWIAGLLAVMAGLRTLYLAEFGSHVPESSDTAFFVEDARRIASGDVFLAGRSLVFNPLYAYFLGAIFAIFGEPTMPVLVIQFVLGIAGAWLLFSLAREQFGPLAALCTLGLTACYGMALLYEGQILDAFLSMLLPTVFLLQLRRAADSKEPWRFFAGGLGLGLFALTRPNVLLFFPLAALWAYFVAGGRDAVRRGTVAAGALAAGAALVILPFTIRNWVQTGEPVLITPHGGINFYVGNNAAATGFFTPPEGLPPLPGALNLEIPRQVAESETGRTGMSDAAVSDYWFGKGRSFIYEHPGRFATLLLRKARAFFNGYEVPSNVDYSLLREISTSLKVAFVPIGFVLPLGLLGMVIASSQDWRRHSLFVLYFVAYAGSVIVFYVTARYRLPVVPVLLLYAGFALRHLFDVVAQPRRLALFSVSLAALFALLNAPLRLRFNEAYLAHSQGFTLEGLGRTQEAVARYQKALRLNPNLVLTHLQLARIYARGGDAGRAAPHYEAAERLAANDLELRREAAEFRERVGRPALVPELPERSER
jgi:4-amino-4-deoxy-L-arabinose transferase-like glycosyltransferase